MHAIKFRIIYYITAAAVIILICGRLNAQSGFDSYLQKDSLYRFNGTSMQIDSLIRLNSGNTFKADSFSRTFGKAEVISLNQLLYLTVNNNPDIAVVQSNIDATKELIKSKGYLPDPMLETEADNIETDFKKVGMINFYASQMFPFPGKLKLESETVMHSRDMLSYEKLMVASDKMNSVKQNYYDLYFVQQKLMINKEDQELIQTILTAAESRYAVNKAMQQDIFKAQIEQSRLKNEEYLLEQSKRNLYSSLTALTRTVISDDTRMNFADIDLAYLINGETGTIDDKQETELVNYAFTHNPELKVIEHKRIMAETDVRMSELNKMPDFNIRVGYRIMPFEEHNAMLFMVGITLPFAPWSSGKYDHAIQKSTLDIRTADSEYDSKKNEIKNMIGSLAANIRSARESMKYYYSVMLPQTENSFKSTQFSYESTLASFLDLMDSYRMYRDTRLMFYESLNMYLKMTAELEKTVSLNLK